MTSEESRPVFTTTTTMWVLSSSFLSFYALHLACSVGLNRMCMFKCKLARPTFPFFPPLSVSLAMCSFTVCFNEAIYTEVMKQIKDLIVPNSCFSTSN